MNGSEAADDFDSLNIDPTLKNPQDAGARGICLYHSIFITAISLQLPQSARKSQKKKREEEKGVRAREKRLVLVFMLWNSERKTKKSKAKHTQETLTQGDMVLKIPAIFRAVFI